MLTEALQGISTKRAAEGILDTFGGFSFSGFNWPTILNVGNLHGKNSALTISAFYNGIEIICNDFAKLPKSVYQKNGNSRESIPHPVKYLIDKKPNQYMTAFQFDKVMLMSTILKGNGYAIKEYNRSTGELKAIQFVDQDNTPVTVKKHNNKLFYTIDKKTYQADDVIHVPGFSFNGITGVGVVTHAMRSLSTNIHSNEFASEYFQDKGLGYGVVSTPKTMDAGAKSRYSSALSSVLSDKASKWKVPVIDEGASFQQLRITPQEAQFLASSEHGINEVARWLNVSPSKLKHHKDLNNSISESLDRGHVNDSILPWAIKFQQEYDTKLFSRAEIDSGIYVKFNINSLLSADMSAQADYWSKLIFSGVYTRNEVRDLLDYNRIDGLDEPLTPVNTHLMEQIEALLAEKKSNTPQA